jgi:hypothetical protein
MKKNLLNSDNDCKVRILTADGHLFAQAEIPNDRCTTADSQGFLLSWNEEEESDPVVLQDVFERIRTGIARDWSSKTRTNPADPLWWIYPFSLPCQ